MTAFIIVVLAIGAFLTLVGLLLLVNNIKLIYWVAVTATFLPLGYISRYFHILPSSVKWLPLVILCFCFMAILLRQVLRQKLARVPKRILFFYYLIFIFSVLSLLFNNVAVLPVLFSGLGLITYLFFSLIMNNKEYKLSQDDLFKIIVKIGIIESVVALFQRVILVWLLNMGSSDMVAGTFSVDGQYTFFQLFCIIIVLVYWFYNRPILRSISNFLLMFIFLASIAVSGNSASLIFLPIIFLSVFLFVNKKRFFLKFRTVVTVIALLTLTIFLYANFWNKDYSKGGRSNDLLGLLTDPKYLREHLFGVEYEVGSNLSKGGSLKRGSALIFSYGLVSGSFETFLLGNGPGTTSESQVPGASGIITQQYEGLKVNRTSYSQIIAELGMGGLCFIIVFMLMLFFWGSYNRQQLTDYRLIRKVTVILLLLYFAYENLFDDLVLGFILSAVTLVPVSNNGGQNAGKNLKKRMVLVN